MDLTEFFCKKLSEAAYGSLNKYWSRTLIWNYPSVGFVNTNNTNQKARNLYMHHLFSLSLLMGKTCNGLHLRGFISLIKQEKNNQGNNTHMDPHVLHWRHMIYMLYGVKKVLIFVSFLKSVSFSHCVLFILFVFCLFVRCVTYYCSQVSVFITVEDQSKLKTLKILK